MVVLSASVLAGSGSKSLVSRQFVEMSRMRVEGLLAAFPKLLSHSKQHTFVETDTVRYVYQPLENKVYLLLITTKSSNIVEDLGTLRLLAKVVPDVTGGFQENLINEHAFELIFAFDEVLTTGGYKEDVTIGDVQTNLLMDSVEEKMQLVIEEKKKDSARKAMEEKASEIKKRQMENLRANIMSGMGAENSVPSTSIMEGFGGGGHEPSSRYEYNSYSHALKSMNTDPQDEPHVTAKTTFSLGKGGKDSNNKNLMHLMADEDNFSLKLRNTNETNSHQLNLSEDVPTVASYPLTISLEEKISVAMNREAGVESCEVKGTLFLTANTDIGSMPSVSINKSLILSKCTRNWSFATHPKVSKPDYENKGILTLKGGKELPLNRSVGVLKWSYHGEDACPLTINCWPENEGTSSMNVNIEYVLTRLDMTIHDVKILIPVGTTDRPSIVSIDGLYTFDVNSGMMCWHHDFIDTTNSTGTLEFSIPGSSIGTFFPVQVDFKSDNLLCPIEVTGVTSTSNGSLVPNNLIKSVIPESYQVL